MHVSQNNRATVKGVLKMDRVIITAQSVYSFRKCILQHSLTWLLSSTSTELCKNMTNINHDRYLLIDQKGFRIKCPFE